MTTLKTALRWKTVLGKGLLFMTMSSTGGFAAAPHAATVTHTDFGTTPKGEAVAIYTLKSAEVEARIMTYGARIVSVKTADRTGKVDDVVLGSDSLAGYMEGKNAYFGAVVGRYGNRIAAGQFSLGGKQYQVPKNENGKNALHGGDVGFDSLVWKAREVPGGVEMTLVSPDGDQGFPGTLTTHVTYTLRGNALHLQYRMTTDKPTVINITNHSYFNLSGEGNGTILHDLAEINADRYTPVDANLIPTGQLLPVAGTPFDFRKATVIGERIDADNEQLKLAGGYDHNWVLNGANRTMKMAARMSDPQSGRVLTVTTTEPGVQFYTGNFLDGTHTGPSGKPYIKRGAFCLETQHFPDSPNHPEFPTTELKPGETRSSETVFTFSTEK